MPEPAVEKPLPEVESGEEEILEPESVISSAVSPREFEVQPPKVSKEAEGPEVAPEVVKAPPLEQEESAKETLRKIETILAEGLNDPPYYLYQSLPSETKITFKQAGEELAREIFEEVQTGKFSYDKIYDASINWLKTLPEEVSHYFIEDQAKKKVQRLAELFPAEEET